jgi:hypothetical protein
MTPGNLTDDIDDTDDLDDDVGIDDLAVGVPFEDLGAALRAGQVHVLFGTSTGISRRRPAVEPGLDPVLMASDGDRPLRSAIGLPQEGR